MLGFATLERMEQISQYPNTFYRVSLKAVIHNANQEVLVVKENAAPFWNLPGGGLDHGESEMTCLKRELHEEVGYEGELSAQPFATDTLWLRSKQAWLLWVLYEVQTEHNRFSLGRDGEEMAFVDPKTFQDSEHLEERLIYKHCTR